VPSFFRRCNQKILSLLSSTSSSSTNHYHYMIRLLLTQPLYKYFLAIHLSYPFSNHKHYYYYYYYYYYSFITEEPIESENWLLAKPFFIKYFCLVDIQSLLRMVVKKMEKSLLYFLLHFDSIGFPTIFQRYDVWKGGHSSVAEP
jgi:hypothetical protein